MSMIDIERLGPISRVTIPVPEGGGLVVLRGRNGAGKTIALQAVDALSRDGGKVTARPLRGTEGGEVTGLGRTIRVGMTRTSRSGELECEPIPEEIDLSTLIAPGIKDPAAADRRRIQAAVALAGVQADEASFAALLPGGLEELRGHLRADTLSLADPVEMADRIRRELHAEALRLEREAEKARAQAGGMLSQLPRESEEEPEPDVSAMEAAVESARNALAGVMAQRAAAIDREGARLKAQARIAEIGEAPDVAALEEAYTTAEAQREELGRNLDAARAEVARLEDAEESSRYAAEIARERVLSAQETERALEAARAVIEEVAGVSGPSEEDVLAAEKARQDATLACQEAIAVRARLDEHRQVREVAAKLRGSAADTEDRAAVLREAARSTDAVLAELLQRIAPPGLTVIEGRLMWRRDDGYVPFADLSDGERARIAVDMVVDALGPECRLLSIGQAYYEGLDPENRKAIAEHARERKVTIVTAEADGGDLRAEVEP